MTISKPKGLLHITFVQGKKLEKSIMMTLLQLNAISPYILCCLNVRPDHPELIQPSDQDVANFNSLEHQDEVVQRTHAISGHNPIWNEKLSYVIHSKMTKVFLDVFDKELKQADHLGKAEIDLSGESLTKDWIKDMWIPLLNDEGKPTGGEIQVLVHFQPQDYLEYIEHNASAVYASYKAKIMKAIEQKALDIVNKSAQSAVDAEAAYEIKKANLIRH
ncbi:hypothetical protein HDU76_013321 [Blyttiomyces sp. JEL0837]|nr:hypothetical protein HDU76_013321 [Blyttiomyces sp. JEL0837]